MDNEDYYAHLGLNRNASQNEIKKTYRRLARKYHPDTNPGDKAAEEKFKKIQEAYDTLKDPKKRKIYNTYGKVPGNFDPAVYERAQRGTPFPGADFSSGFRDVHFEDFFGDIFDRSQRQAGPRPGQDVIQSIKITLQEALEGAKKSLSIQTHESCDQCNGGGRKEGPKTRVCHKCRGSGRQNISQGPLNFSTECASCGGVGKTGLSRCSKCRGTGTVGKIENVNIKIPPGVSDGQKIRVRGKGGIGRRGGPRGNLYLKVSMAPHPKFDRKGADLYAGEKISFPQAALGAKIEVETLDGGKTTMTIPPGTQGGQKFRLKGKGLPKKGAAKSRGDLFVTVNIYVPKNIDDKTRKQIRDLDLKPADLKGKP